MSWIPPLVVAVPLLAAALVAGGDHVLPSRVQDAIGVAATAAVCAFGIVLMRESMSQDVIHWFGGWRPHSGAAIGIDFAVDPFGAGMVALVGAVAVLSLVYARMYLQELARLFDALLLLITAAICGFAMTGDLFNMFVWLELMGVAAYALTGFEVRQAGPLQGAVNFSIVNTIGGYLVVIGTALLYARTGALNFAQIGRTLAGEKPGGLLVVAMTLIVCGFFCKAAVVPFHLWLGDAYAVAPAPVCALFAAVMTEVGLFGVARVYWTVFDAPFGAHQQVERAFLIDLDGSRFCLHAVPNPAPALRVDDVHELHADASAINAARFPCPFVVVIAIKPQVGMRLRRQQAERVQFGLQVAELAEQPKNAFTLVVFNDGGSSAPAGIASRSRHR